MNLGSRPKNHRRPSKKRRKRRPSKQQKKRRPTKKQTKRRPSKRKRKRRPIRKEKKRLNVADIMFEIHRSLIPKPDPEIIPIVENRGFFRGLFKLYYGK